MSTVPRPEFDHFALERQIPNPAHIFDLIPARADELKDKCVFALDANALLAPQKLGPKALPEVRRIVEPLARDDRLFVPARAVREYGKNRTNALRDIHKQVADRLSGLGDSAPFTSPMLERHPAFMEAAKALETLREARKNYKNALQTLLEALADWQWKDPISDLYRELLPRRIVDHKLSEDQLLADLKYRITHKLPPGYKDQAKDDEGIGDVAIWHSILQLAKDKQRSVVFVTNEIKPDWVVKQGDAVICPRFELVFEFRRETGQQFALVNFARFLELSGAPSEVIEEARLVTLERDLRQRSSFSSLCLADRQLISSYASYFVLIGGEIKSAFFRLRNERRNLSGDGSKTRQEFMNACRNLSPQLTERGQSELGKFVNATEDFFGKCSRVEQSFEAAFHDGSLRYAQLQGESLLAVVEEIMGVIQEITGCAYSY
jgi:hypothetical protein